MADNPITAVDALARAVKTDPGRPLVTFYDSGSGERVELSVATVDNWVCKLVNLFSVELALEPGDDIVVDLPTSWQSSVVLLAAWSAGLVVSLRGGGAPALRFVGPSALRQPVESDHVVACSLLPLGGPFASPLPSGWLDFALEVPGQADVVLAPVAVSPTDKAVRTVSDDWSHADLHHRATRRAHDIGLQIGGRLLTDLNPASDDGLVTCVAAPLMMSSSVVLAVNAVAVDRARIAEQERATCAYWCAG